MSDMTEGCERLAAALARLAAAFGLPDLRIAKHGELAFSVVPLTEEAADALAARIEKQADGRETASTTPQAVRMRPGPTVGAFLGSAMPRSRSLKLARSQA